MSNKSMSDDDVCPSCNTLVIDHSIRQMRDCHPTQDLNLPFEKATGDLTFGDMEQAGGIVMLACAIEMPHGKVPAIVFRFVHPDGLNFYPDRIYACEPQQLQQVVDLVTQTASQAIAVCEQ